MNINEILRRYPSIMTSNEFATETSIDDLVVRPVNHPNGGVAIQMSIRDKNTVMSPNQARNLARTLLHVLYGKGMSKKQ
jgi:hypothetical protein